jgi:hypothetical protein
MEAMGPENPSKTLNLPGFHTQARPGMAILVCFWAEKLILIIFHQFLHRKAKISIFKMYVSWIQLSIARFLGDPAHSLSQEFLWTDFESSKSTFSSTLTMSKIFY